MPAPGIPESFKVLIKELQSLSLDVKVLDTDNNEIDLKQHFDDDDDMVLQPVMDEDYVETEEIEDEYTVEEPELEDDDFGADLFNSLAGEADDSDKSF